MDITIHRDHTFVVRGERFHLQRSGPYGTADSEWVLSRQDGSDKHSESFQTLAEVREHVARCVQNDWPILDESVEP